MVQGRSKFDVLVDDAADHNFNGIALDEGAGKVYFVDEAVGVRSVATAVSTSPPLLLSPVRQPALPRSPPPGRPAARPAHACWTSWQRRRPQLSVFVPCR